MRSRFAASVAALALVLAGCSASATPVPSMPAATTAPATSAPATATPANLTIYGAASLTAVLAKVKTTYEAANPGTTLTISTDSSTALETKIEQGAPADVFLSADTANPQKLVDDGYGLGPVTKFAGNLLTIIVPTGNPAGIQTPADLAKSGVKIVTCGPTVPIAKYAAQLVANWLRSRATRPTRSQVQRQRRLPTGQRLRGRFPDRPRRRRCRDRLRDRRQDVHPGHHGRHPGRGERARDVRRRRGQGIRQPGRGPGLPDLARRPGRPDGPGLVRVPPGPLT